MTTTTPTHFELLGLPARFDLDSGEIERNYLAQSRAVHPDYHQQASSSEQRVSLEMSAALNDAYSTLRQPFRRAEYLLTLEGGPSAAEVKDMAPDFLEEMLELRMEIEELREQGHDSPGRQTMEKQLVQRSDGLVRQLKETFGRLEKIPGDDAARRGVLVQIRRILNTARYIQGLLRDLRAD